MGSIYAKLLLTAFFWGGTFIAGRILAAQAGPFTGSFLRFAVACAALVLVTLRTEGLPRPNRRDVMPLVLMGFTGIFGYNWFFLQGLKTVEAGRASIIIACNPIAIALAAAVVFGERLTPLKVGGILVSIAGAVTVITRGSISSTTCCAARKCAWIHLASEPPPRPTLTTRSGSGTNSRKASMLRVYDSTSSSGTPMRMPLWIVSLPR